MGTIIGKTSSPAWTYKLEAIETGTHINENTSAVEIAVYIGRASSRSYLGGNWTGSVTVDNQTIKLADYITYPTYINGGEWLEIARVNFPKIQHNSDGSKTASVSSSFSSGGNFVPHTASAEGSIKLTTLARATEVPDTTVYIKENNKILLKPLSNSYSHSVQIVFGNIKKYLQKNGSLGNSEYKFTTPNIPFVPDKSFYAQFTGEQGEGQIVVRTYAGATQVSPTTWGILYVRASATYAKPTLSGADIRDVAPDILHITRDEHTFIKYCSDAYIRIDDYLTPGDPEDTNAKLTTWSVNNVNGSLYDNISWVDCYIWNVTTNKFTITLRNNRGLSITKTFENSGEFVPYSKLVQTCKLQRAEATTGEVRIDCSGSFYNGMLNDDLKNSLRLAYTYKEKNATSWETSKLFTLDEDIRGTIIDGETVNNIIVNELGQELWNYYLNLSSDEELFPIFRTNTGDGILCNSTLHYEDGSNEPSYVFLLILEDSGNGYIELGSYRIYANGQVDVDYKFKSMFINSMYGHITLLNNTHPLYNALQHTSLIDIPNISISGNQFSKRNHILDTRFDYKKQYTIRVYVLDYMSSAYLSNEELYTDFEIARGLPVFWWNATSMYIMDKLYVNGGQVRGEKEIWSGSQLLSYNSATQGATKELYGLPDLSKYSGETIKLYISVGQRGSQQVFEYTTNGDRIYTIGLVHGASSFTDTTDRLYIFLARLMYNSATDSSDYSWTIHVDRQSSLELDGSVGTQSMNIYLKKITIS